MNISKITTGIFLALVALALIVFAVCLFGSADTVVLSDGLTPSEPNDPHVGLLLGFTYFLLGLTVAATVASAVMSFMVKLNNNPKKSFIMIGGIGFLALIMIITYATGDGTPMHLYGYDGSQNTAGWLKLSDMFLRTAYVLIFLCIAAIIANAFAKKIKF